MARRYKTLGFSVPPMIATRIEEVVRERQLTRSELFREMFRAWEKLDQRARVDPDSDEEIRQSLQERARSLGIVVTEDGEILEKTRV